MIARIHFRARLSLLLLAVVSTAVVPTRAFGQSCLAGTAADEFTADAAGLKREWILQLPYVASGYRLDQVVAGDGLVVAQTSDGTVHAVQDTPWGESSPPVGAPQPGSLLWSQRIGTDGGPTTRAGIGPDLVVVPHGRGIAGLERSNGHPRWQEPFDQTASAGAAVIGNWAYVPGSTGTINRFAVNPLRHPVEITKADDKGAAAKSGKKAANKKTKPKRQRQESLAPIRLHAGGSNKVESAAIPLAAGVLWCTSDGLLVTLQPSELDWRRLEFSLENPPAGSPVVRDRSVFASTTSGDLARIELPVNNKELQLAWHTVLPGPAFSGPFLSGDTIVVSLGDLGIAAYSAETGSELWHSCLTGTILAVGGGRVWLVDELGKLSGFDLADGTPRERLCLGPFTLPVVNNRSERLLLASPSGMLVSLSPRATGTPTPADASEAAATSPAAPARGPSDPDATLRP